MFQTLYPMIQYSYVSNFVPNDYSATMFQFSIQWYSAIVFQTLYSLIQYRYVQTLYQMCFQFCTQWFSTVIFQTLYPMKHYRYISNFVHNDTVKLWYRLCTQWYSTEIVQFQYRLVQYSKDSNLASDASVVHCTVKVCTNSVVFYFVSRSNIRKCLVIYFFVPSFNNHTVWI